MHWLRHCGRVAGGQRLLFLLLRFGGVQEAGGVSQVAMSIRHTSVCLAFHCSAQATPHTGAALIAAPWPAADAPVDEAAAAQFETLQARGGWGGGTDGLAARVASSVPSSGQEHGSKEKALQALCSSVQRAQEVHAPGALICMLRCAVHAPLHAGSSAGGAQCAGRVWRGARPQDCCHRAVSGVVPWS